MDPEPVVGGMSAVITALTAGLTETAFFSVLVELVPFIIMIVPVAFGFYLFRKLVKGASKGKARV